MKLTNERIEEIRKRTEVATPGYWKYVPIVDRYEFFVEGDSESEAVAESVFTKEDADFIANARQDIPDLLAEVERLRNRLQNAEEIIELDTVIINRLSGKENE